MEKNIKIKISDNTHKKQIKASNFSITYSARKMDNAIASYDILTALKAEDNIIIEVNSSLLNLSEMDKRTLISDFVDSLEQLGIEFTKKKTMDNSKRSILSIGIEGKKIEGFELFVSIPHEVWCDPRFSKIIPKVGVRYYLPKSSFENNIAAFVNLDEDEKLELCRMVIFDHVLVGSMGINTSIFEKNDIIELLK